MRSKSERIRSQLGHPVIDSDGHVLEYLPAAFPYLEVREPHTAERVVGNPRPEHP
jgi:hypothetical protein